MAGTVLITRPHEDAQVTAQEIQDLGYDVFCEAFLAVVYHKETLADLEQYAGLIFTSKNGVRSLCWNTRFREIDVYAVGDETAAEARKVGFENVKSADGDFDDLLKLLSNLPSDRPYLYIRGQHTSRVLSNEDLPVRVEEIITYHTDKKEEISTKAQKLMLCGALSDVLFFSKRTAESFVAYVQAHPRQDDIRMGLKRTKALCLGDSMVELLSVLPWKEVLIAERPRRDELLSLL